MAERRVVPPEPAIEPAGAVLWPDGDGFRPTLFINQIPLDGGHASFETPALRAPQDDVSLW